MTPKPSAALDIRSIEKGLLIPCMSSDNRLNIVNPDDGLMVYDTIQSSFYFWNKAKSAWYALNPWSYRSPESNGTSYDIYTLLNANVGIGVLLPQAKLHVNGNLRVDNNLQVNKDATVTGNMSAATFTGNGAGVTNVDAATLGGHPSSYFGVATDVTALQTGKADKTDLFTASKTVTVSSTGYCGIQNTVSSAEVSYSLVGNIVFVSGVIYFKVTWETWTICAQLTDIPIFPEGYGKYATGASVSFYNSGYDNMGGSMQFHSAASSGYGNIIQFHRIENKNFNNGNWRCAFQFFYHIQ